MSFLNTLVEELKPISAKCAAVLILFRAKRAFYFGLLVAAVTGSTEEQVE